MPRPKTNWVVLRVRIPSDWKEVLEDIRKQGAYESISDVVRSILRERIVEAHYKRLHQKQLIKEAVVEVLREHKIIP